MDHGQLSMVGHKFQWVFPEPLLHPVAKTFQRTVWPRKGCIQKIGKIEAADGGTIFLDEIGELTPAA
jgi:hypothetical protein